MPESVCPALPVGVYTLEFSAASGDKAPRFPGNAWRGALGHSLRRLACITGARDCQGCPQTAACAYAYIFDTPLPASAAKMRLYEQAPHPFTLREEEGANGPRLVLTLFGRGNAYLPLMVLALRQAAAAERGVGGRRLHHERTCQWNPIPPGAWVPIDGPAGAVAPLSPLPALPVPDCPTGEVRITLHSPLRIKRSGKPVRPNEFVFADFFSSLLRRISMLTYFHTDTPFETDFRSLTDAARKVNCETQLKWVDQERYSARQKAAMNMGGVVGILRVQGPDLLPFWPLLCLGQATHTGSGATMGLGHYTLASLPASDNDVAVE